MNANDLLLLAFDSALADQWESLQPVLADLSDEKAAWQPPAYAQVPHDEGVGVPGTILWHLNHLEWSHRLMAAMLPSRAEDRKAGIPPPGELPLGEILPKLKQAEASMRAAVADLRPEDLPAACTSRENNAEIVLGATRHLAAHTGKIIQTNRLFKHR
jgi:hypothetical protein